MDPKESAVKRSVLLSHLFLSLSRPALLLSLSPTPSELCRVNSLECEQISLCSTLIPMTDVCPCPSPHLLFPLVPPLSSLCPPFSLYSALRPPPHRDYLNGYPGIPASDPSKDPPPSRDPLFQLPHLVSLSLTSVLGVLRLKVDPFDSYDLKRIYPAQSRFVPLRKVPHSKRNGYHSNSKRSRRSHLKLRTVLLTNTTRRTRTRKKEGLSN